jgi:hypothetical protein
VNFKSLILTAGIAISGIVANGADSANAALIVNTTSDANVLGNTIAGTGISASNFTYTGGAVASGTFSKGLVSGIGINSGIIMTSGNANLAVGGNSQTGAGLNQAVPGDINGVPGAAGDGDLDGLAGTTTYDASVLEFDFTTASNNVFLNFVFASEEYPEYVNSAYNDVFAFFLDGQNIALIPGTTTPVSINNINSLTNSGLYNDNTGGTGIEYDGFTSLLTASGLGLTPGNHHIKIAIADVGDGIYDSAVFLQLNSFADTPQPAQQVPEPFTIVGSIIGGSAALRMRKKLKDTTKA